VELIQPGGRRKAGGPKSGLGAPIRKQDTSTV